MHKYGSEDNSFYLSVTMGWQTTWEWRTYHEDCYLSRFNQSETGRRTDGRILEIYTTQGRKIEVVGWAWEYLWGIGHRP